jgi:hypothetical protein
VGQLQAATKYDYRISETATGNPAFAPLEPTGGFGAFGRAGRGGGGRYERGGLRPLPGGSEGGRAQRTLPGERIAGIASAPTVPAAEARRELEQALAEMDASASVDRPIGAQRPAPDRARSHRPMSVFAFGVSRKRLEQAVRDLGLPVVIARDVDEADVVMTLKNEYKQKTPLLREAEERAMPIYVLKSNTIPQMQSSLTSIFSLEIDPREAALRETEDAIEVVLTSSEAVELSPQNAYIRRLQHQMAERANLVSRSRGREPFRRVRLYPDAARSTWR